MRNRIVRSAATLAFAAASSTMFSGMPSVFADTLQTTDFASQASISTATEGPADATFAATETAYSGSLVSGDAWRGYQRQVGRQLNITLPQTVSLKSLSIEMRQNPGLGISFPSDVTFEVQYNGQWYNVGTAHNRFPSTDKRNGTQTYSVTLNNIQAKQIRITFPVIGWVFARHLHINGTVGAGNPPTGSVSQPSTSFQQPLSPLDSRAKSIHNMLLVYTGANGSLGTWSSNDFLPMVGYQSLGTSQYVGKMFDTMLFLPYASLGDTQDAWQGYLNDLFEQGQQLSALDAAVGQMNQTLGTYGSKEKVVLTLPYPHFGKGTWGSVNGVPVNFSGTSSDPSAVKAREQALEWYTQTLLGMWQSAGFQNLELTGLYWDNEQVSYGSPGEVSLIKDASNLAHQDNLPLFWIPFYDAAGIGDWKTLGFDAAWLQPNFIEQGDSADIARIHNAEDCARRYGLGVEVEFDGSVSDNTYQNLYAQTLNQLAQDGFAGNVSHAYYMGSKSLVQAANSYDLDTRLVYNSTYNLITTP